MDNSFECSGWTRVTLGDVVRNAKTKVDPETSGLERYVAGQHMQTDDLHIREWGIIGDGYLGPAFHRKFVKGQVLYGSRRTYLRKVAVAEWDGVCANTTFVLEPKDQRLLPELLPFIMSTDRFHEHSITNSRGSVNPYVNWKDVSWYEFALPPLEEQRWIAEILWAADAAVEKYLDVQQALERVREAAVEDFLQNGFSKSHPRSREPGCDEMSRNWSYVKCAELFEQTPRNGYSPKSNARHQGYPTLSISAVKDGQVIAHGEHLKWAAVPPEKAQEYRLQAGDLLVVRGNGNRDLVGRCGIVGDVPEGCFYPDLLIRISFKPSLIRPRFGEIQWNSRSVHQRLLRHAKSTSGIWKINGKDLREHLFLVPPLEEQDTFLEMVDKIDKSLNAARASMQQVQDLKRSLINQLLAEG